MKKNLYFLFVSLIGIFSISCENTSESIGGKYKVVATGSHKGHDYVDLGLSVKWATCNVGAFSPEDYGDYYAWGETSTKSKYTYDNYTLHDVDLGDIKGTRHDVAHVKWGGDWYMPTITEFQELMDRCNWKWITYNGVQGYKITGPNGNSIFLPAAGSVSERTNSTEGERGRYWSSTGEGSYLAFSEYGKDIDVDPNMSMYIGYPIRPVTKCDNKYEKINDYVSVDTEYECYAWHITIESQLHKLYPNAKLEYGIRYYYDNVYEYTSFFNGDGLGVVYTKFSDTYIDVFYSIALQQDCAEELFYWVSYMELKDKIDSGNELSRDEENLYNSVVKALDKLEDKCLYDFSGHVFVRVDGMEYDILKFEY